MINITNITYDKKVNSQNVQFEISIQEYATLAKNILHNNPFQRNRLNKNGSIYNLLKHDILEGCIIPSIVLASTIEYKNNNQVTNEELNTTLKSYNQLKILDGLQRTYSIIEVYDQHKSHFDSLKDPYTIRAEIYLSISDTGILYRMLTLNTGQTPMTLRHQLEILYSQYLDQRIDELNIGRDIDEFTLKSLNDFKFSDLIEGYSSFIEKNEMPIDRFDILETVKTIDFISKGNGENLDFKSFVLSFRKATKAFENRYGSWEYPIEDKLPGEFKTNANPYGRNLHRIFNRSQTITGFGAAIGELIDLNALKDLSELNESTEKIIFNDNDLLYLNKYIDDIREKSNKIGNGQRIFFKLFFKYLFDKEGSSHLNVKTSLDKAKNRALAEV